MFIKINLHIYRLMYERVPLTKGPFMLHLDDPVIEVIPMVRLGQSHTLSELPMGKYIVCGEAMVMGEVRTPKSVS